MALPAPTGSTYRIGIVCLGKLGFENTYALTMRRKTAEEMGIRTIEDLRGRKIAVPNRFSNQRLIIFKALKDHGMKFTDVGLVEMPPPDMPAALYSHAVDAIISGEPFMAQSEMDGYGRVLFYAKDLWPDFISCVLAVPESVIARLRESVSTPW